MRQNNDSRLILVVDDDEDCRGILSMFLGWRGYDVVEASNGLHAVDIATKNCPDLVFMELSMPIMDGFKAVRLLRDLPRTRDVPIVVCTAYDTPDHREQALSRGFNAFLTKPIDFKEVESILGRLLSGPE